MKHFPLSFDGQNYKFGIGEFGSLKELIDHFENIPVIGSQSGTVLRIVLLSFY